MRTDQLRELSDEELAARVRDSRKELFNLRFQHATGQLDNPHKLAATRHEIARLLTLLHEREVESQQHDKAATGGDA